MAAKPRSREPSWISGRRGASARAPPALRRRRERAQRCRRRGPSRAAAAASTTSSRSTDSEARVPSGGPRCSLLRPPAPLGSDSGREEDARGVDRRKAGIQFYSAGFCGYPRPLARAKAEPFTAPLPGAALETHAFPNGVNATEGGKEEVKAWKKRYGPDAGGGVQTRRRVAVLLVRLFSFCCCC